MPPQATVCCRELLLRQSAPPCSHDFEDYPELVELLLLVCCTRPRVGQHHHLYLAAPFPRAIGFRISRRDRGRMPTGARERRAGRPGRPTAAGKPLARGKCDELLLLGRLSLAASRHAQPGMCES
jgi:hypothetical protein